MAENDARRRFPPVFWLVIVFEFFERGSYYGVMSVLSVYLTDILHFAKEDVGLIKGTIQPLLYFMPIVTGALADRFGYRRTLLVAFTLLGGGYFLTSQLTTYTAVFLALCVMGLGAGAFKPIISGTIARVTDSSNSTLAFGVYYWSINLGAFLSPLFLVPYLKNNIGWQWVLVAAAVGTGAMLLPTLFLFREPAPAEPESIDEAPRRTLIETLADAFEIIYSPVVLVVAACRRRRSAAALTTVLLVAAVALAAWQYAAPRRVVAAAPGESFEVEGGRLEVRVERDMGASEPFTVAARTPGSALLVVHRPGEVERLGPAIIEAVRATGAAPGLEPGRLRTMVEAASEPVAITVEIAPGAGPVAVGGGSRGGVAVRLADPARYSELRSELLEMVQALPGLEALPDTVLDDLVARASRRPFLVGFVVLLLLVAALVLRLRPRFDGAGSGGRAAMAAATVAVLAAVVWLLPGLSLFARVVSTVISATVPSIFLIELGDERRYRDHWRFLLLIFLYSGFWILYFQMFDSVLWYVKAYVDAAALDRVVNGLLLALGLPAVFRFDVEHVTVVNAGTIILLQLIVSKIVARTRALPTMVVGIALGTIGMAILAASTAIWVFIAGIVIFSIGEMTAHPKFVSYVGQIAPRDRVATYMGYIFLYGVIGSSIGSVVGAKLYVHWVDQLNQPRTLWIIFALIGVATIVALLVYDRAVGRHEGSAR